MIALLALATGAHAYTNTYNWGGGTGDWDIAGNWIEGTVPTGSDRAIIGSGAPNLTANTAIATLEMTGGSITESAAGSPILEIREDMAVTGGTIAGTITIRMTGSVGSAPYTLTSSGVTLSNVAIQTANTIELGSDITLTGSMIIASGTLDASGSSYDVSLGGDWDGTGGTFTPRNGTVTFTGTGTIYTETFWDFAVTASGTYTLGGAIVVSDDFLLNSGTLDVSGSNYQISVAGDWTRGGGLFNENSGTVRFTGTGAINDSDTFYNLVVTGGTRSSGVGVTVSNVLTFSGGATTFSGGTLSAVTLTMSGGDLTVNAAGVLSVSGDMTVSNAGSAYDGSGTASVGGNLSVSAGTMGGTAALTVTGNVSVSGTGTLNGNARTISVGGDWDESATFNAGTSTVTFTGTAPSLTATDPFYNLTVNGTSVTLASAIDVDNTLLISAGFLDVSASNYGVTVGGNWTNNVGAAGFVEQNGTVTLDNAGSNSNETFYNLTVSAGARTAAAGFTVSSLMTVSGGSMSAGTAGAVSVNTLTLSGGDMTVNAPTTLTVTTGNFTINAAASSYGGTGTVTISSADLVISDGTHTFGGTLTLSAADGDILVSGGTTTLSGSATANGATGGAAVSGGTLNNDGLLTVRTLAVSGTGTEGGTGNISVTGNVTITGGTLNGNARTISVGGDWDESATFNAGTSTVTFTGTAPSLTATDPFYNLTVNGTSVTLASAITVSNALTITAGTLNDGGNTVTVAVSWSNAGTYTATGTVVFDTAATTTISGSTTFNNFSCTVAGKTLQFQAGQTQTIAGNFTITGAAGNLIPLLSQTPGVQWIIRRTGGADAVTFAFVQDSDVPDAGSNNITANTSRDEGNNDVTAPGCWVFPSTAISWNGGGGDSNWKTAANWNLGYEPNQWDLVTLPNAQPGYPATLAAATTVKDLTIASAASASLAGFALTVTGTYDNQGTLYRLGTGGESAPADTDSGRVIYQGAGGTVQDYATPGLDYYELEIAGDLGATFTLAADLEMAGDLTLTSGILDVTAINRQVTVGDDWVLAGGSFTERAGTVVLSGVFDGTASVPAETFWNVTASTAVTMTGAWDVNNDLTIGGGASLATGGNAITIAGDWTNSGTFTAGGNTVTFDGAAAQALNSGGSSFANLTYSGTPTLTVTGNALTVTGTLTIGDGVTVDMTSQNFTVATLVNGTAPPGGVLSLDGTQVTQSITVMDIDSGLVLYDGTSGNGTVRITSFFDLSFNDGGLGRTFTLNGATTVARDATITSGTVALADLSLSVGRDLTGAGTMTAAAGGAADAVTVGGNWNIGVLNAANSLVTFTGSSGAGPFTVTSNGQSFYDVVLNTAGPAYAQADAASVGRDLTLTAGTWQTNGTALGVGRNLSGAGTLTAAAAEAITVGGNWDVAVFTAATSTVTFTGSSGAGPFTVDTDGSSFYNLVLSGVGKTYSQTDPASVTNDMTLTAGTWQSNSQSLDVDFHLTGAGTLTAAGAEAITVGGDFTPTGFNSATSTVTLDTATAGNLAGRTFYNLVLAKGAAGAMVTSTGGLTVTNALTMAQGTWDAATFTHTVAGAWDSSAAAFTLTAGTSEISLSAANPTITSRAGNSFYDLTLASGGTLASAITATRDVTITAGTLLLSGNALTVDGHLTGDALTAAGAEAIAVGGNWNIATWTRASSTVTFNGLRGAGPFTVTSNGQFFYDVVLDAAGKVYSQTDAASVTNNMTLTAGTWQSSGQSLDVDFDLTGAAGTLIAGGSQITVGGDFTPNAFDRGTSRVTLDTDKAANLAGHTFYDLVFNKDAAVWTITSTGGLTVTNTLTMTRGTWDAATFTHTVAGAWNSSAANFNLTAGTSTISLSPTPNPTITSRAGNSFYNLTVNNGGGLLSAITATNDLSLAGGTLTLSGWALTVGRHLSGAGTLTASASEAITVGGSFTPSGFNCANSIVTLDGLNAGNLGGLTFYDLEFNKGTPGTTLTSTGGLAVTHALTMTQGTWDAATFAHSIRVDWNATSANFNFAPSTSTIDMNTGSPLSVNCSGTNYFWNLTVSTVVNLASAIVVLNDVTITASGQLNQAAAAYQITIGHNWTRTAPGTFNPHIDGWVVFNDNAFTAGGALSTTAAGGEAFSNLRIDEAGGTFTYNSDLTIRSEMHLLTGTLAEGAGTRTITMGDAANLPTGGIVYWDNDADIAGGTGYAAGDGTVEFVLPAPWAYHIEGRTIFRNIDCLTPNAVLKFEENGVGAYTPPAAGTQIATIIDGVFRIDGGASGTLITLTNISGAAAPECALPTDPPDPLQWVLHIRGTADIKYADISNSWAPDYDAITPGEGSVNSGGNCNWLFSIPVEASWTVDSDSNGRIDRIRVQVTLFTQLSDNFDPSKFEITVDGYQVIGYGTAAGANDDVFDVLLQEKPYLDTDVRPTWRIVRNDFPNGLYGQNGGAYVAVGVEQTADDGARPVLAFTLAVANENRAYLHFSEPVWSNAGATVPIGAADFTYSDAANPFTITALSPAGSGTHDAMLEFGNPITDADVILPRTVSALANAVYDQPYVTDPATYPNTNLDGNLSGASKPMLAAAHRISDVGLGLITPVWASDWDPVSAAPVTGRDPQRGGIGRITAFDGSGWLQDLDVLLQARVEAAAWAASPVDLYYDVGVTAPIRFSGLWVPVVTASDVGHNPNAAARSVAGAINGVLRDFVIPAGDSEIRDGADLEFTFVVAGLPCADVADRRDPRTARPWGWSVRGIRTQRGSVTIMNNVINPERGERTSLHYKLADSGTVTITVFDLKGDIVDVLYRGQQSAGEHSTTWDGRNRGGNVVARGVYFVKLVGPGVSETRKVMVVK